MKNGIQKLLTVLLPASGYRRLFGAYHLALAYLGAVLYGFPSRRLAVIAVTGTKGKSTTVEILRVMLREAGLATASASTIRFCIGENCERNLYKMTMPGRFFLQRFLRRAQRAGCTHAVIEMTSEGAAQFRHKGIELDALVFTNVAPEHVESHGGMEAYVSAKLSLAGHLSQSHKRPRIIVANKDDAYGEAFLNTDADIRAPFSLADAAPYSADDRGARFLWRGELFSSPLPGKFNVENALAALTLGEALGLPRQTMKKALEHMEPVPGRAQSIEHGQPFRVIVDYAHTPESLRALYEAFVPKAEEGGEPGRRLCVLGATGGGRDKGKRPKLGAVADEFCDIAFVTDEDPYDEDPEEIIGNVARGFTRLVPRQILMRREAIRAALAQARAGDVVLITGKGTDPYIMRARGAKEVWSDADVASEELSRRTQTGQ